jgi:multidrug efflux pump subunit AcrA (membrane-fusion protein)
MTVQIGPLATESDTAGSVSPVTQSAVASQVAGVVLRVVHLAGDWVKEGETVVQLDDSQLALAVQNASAALENAKINFAIGKDNASQSNPKLALQVQAAQSTLSSAQKNYDAQKALFDLGGTSASQLDNAKSQLQMARANLEAAKTALDQNQKSDTQTLAQMKLAIDQATNQLAMAKLNLQNAAIRAPFDGQIAAVNVNPGMYVSLNTSVFILVSAERQITFNVPPSDAPNLPVGTQVRFTYHGHPYTVRIRQAPSAPIGGVVPMVAAVPAAITLPYGGVGTVTYSLTLASGAIVPIAALETNEDRNYVFTVVEGKAAMQPITILGEAGIMAAVAGVAGGAQVIVNAPPGLIAGSTVQVVSSQAARSDSPKGAPTGEQGQKGRQ